MSELLSNYQDFLYEMLPAAQAVYRPGPLFEMLERELAERKRADDAWLATLTPRELRVELTRRRIETLENRYRAWWDEHMAWRFAPRRPDREEW